MSTPIRISLELTAPSSTSIGTVTSSIGSQIAAGLEKNSALRLALSKVMPGGVSGVGGVAGGAGLSGAVTQQLTQLAQIGPRAAAAVAGVGSAGNQSNSTLRTMISLLNPLASGLWLAEKAGRALQSSLTLPVDFVKRLAEAGDQYRRFSSQISSAVGSSERAVAITQQLRLSSQNTPLSAVETLNAARSAAFVPGLSGKIAMSSPAGAAKQFAEYADLLRRSTVLARDGDVGNSSIAIREFLAGQGQSFQRRLNTSPQSVADAIGKKLSEVLADPNLGLLAIEKFIKTTSGSSSLNDQQALFSTAVNKLVDAIDQAFASLSSWDRSGSLYDELVDRMRGVSSLILESIDPTKNSNWNSQKDRIGKAITESLDNITNSASRLLQKIGANNNPIDTLAETVTRLWEASAKATELLPSLGEALGRLGKWVLDAARQIAGVVEHGFSGSVKVAGLSVPVSIGDSDRIAELKTQIARAESRPIGPVGSRMRRDDERNLQHNRDALAALLGGGSGPGSFSSAVDGIQDFSLADLGRPFAIQRNIRNLIEGQTSGLNFASVARSAVEPIQRAGGDFDWRSGFTRILEREDSIKSSLDKMFYDRELGYPNLEKKAQRDLEVAKSARYLPGSVRLKIPMPWQFDSGLTTESVGDVLERSIGGEKTEAFLSGQLEDKKDALAAIQGLPKRLTRELQDLAGATAASLKDLPPNVAATIGAALKENVNGVADQIAMALNLPPDLAQNLRDAVSKGPEELLRLVDDATAEARLRAVTAQLPRKLPSSASDFLADPLNTPRQQSEALIAFRSTRQDELKARYDSASEKLASSPGDRELQAAQGFAAINLRENQRQLLELKKAIDDVGQAYNDMASKSRDALESNLGDAINGLITGSGNLRSVLLSFVNDITRAFSQMAARNLVQAVIGDAGRPGQGAGGQGVGGFSGLLGPILGAAFGAFGGGAASGANQSSTSPYFQTHNPVAFAEGGIVDRPTYTLSGERGAEAFVPLSRNRRIPVTIVQAPRGAHGIDPGDHSETSGDNARAFGRLAKQMAGGASGHGPINLTMYYCHSETDAFRRGYQASKHIILGDVHKEARTGGTLRKVLKGR